MGGERGIKKGNENVRRGKNIESDKANNGN